MEYLVLLDVGGPALELDDDELVETFETPSDRVIEGLTSVDMEKDIAACLASWYLNVLDEDVKVSVQDVIEVQPKKDGRKVHAFKIFRRGGLGQVN